MLNKSVHEDQMFRARCAANGTLSAAYGFTAGASGTGSCTLTDTSLYTYVFPLAFKEYPHVSVSLETASVRAEVTITTTGCTVRTYSYDGTTKTAAIHSIQVVGKGNDRG